MNNVKCSIVVPIYNVDNYIDECVGSIIAQTYKNIEIVLVDDGSTDNSGIKCEQWAQQDSRIKVFHKPNGGLMSAWKYGVLQSTGEYIGFVDSDDWIDVDMYERLIGQAQDSGADLVLCGLVHKAQNKSVKAQCRLERKIYAKEEIEQQIYPSLVRNGDYYSRGLSPNRVTKLFKRNLLLSVLKYCDEQVSIGEDLLTTFAYMSKVNTVAALSDFCPYHYRSNDLSMVHTFSDQKYEKLEFLKRAMEKANADLYEYDFRGQINADYITLMLQQIEQEILISNKTFKDLKKSIKNRVRISSFLEAKRNMDKSKLSRKAKFYLFLIKCRLIGTLIVIRKLKKVRM